MFHSHVFFRARLIREMLNMKFIANIKETFGEVTEDKRDSGDLVSTIIIIAGMAVAAILAINWLSTAVINSAADVAECIEGSSSGFISGDEARDNCEGADHASDNSFKEDTGYTGRY